MGHYTAGKVLRAAAPHPTPQGREAARVSGLYRVRGGPLYVPSFG